MARISSIESTLSVTGNSQEQLSEHAQARAVWERKPVLRIIYRDLFDTILAETVAGSIIEIGGGVGWLKEYRREVISSDLHFSPQISFVANAETLPFANDSVDNIVMLDVLHHVPLPRRALLEAERVLSKGGRLIMLEPGVSLGSYLFYKVFNPEPVDLRVDPLAEFPLSTQSAYDANQAIPTLLIGNARRRLRETVPNLTITKSRWMSFFAYPLSGGLRSWSLLPTAIASTVLAIERRIPNLIGRLFGFRVLIVMERM